MLEKNDISFLAVMIPKSDEVSDGDSKNPLLFGDSINSHAGWLAPSIRLLE